MKVMEAETVERKTKTKTTKVAAQAAKMEETMAKKGNTG
jgi:hypothetical protein